VLWFDYDTAAILWTLQSYYTGFDSLLCDALTLCAVNG